jgi:transposase InsO family protein
MRYRVVDEVRGLVPVVRACTLMRLSPSGYYAWRERPQSARERENRGLLIQIRTIHRMSRGTYGAPRVHAELRAQGTEVGRRRVARLMQQDGIRALRRRKRRVQTPSAPLEAIPANVLDRQFMPDRPGAVWTADITYLPTAEGWIRRWSIADRSCD